MNTERRITKRDEKGRVLEYTFLVDGTAVPEGKKYCNACSSIKDVLCFSPRGGSCRECANKRARDYFHTVKKDGEWLKVRNERITKWGLERKQRAVAHLGGKYADCAGVFPPPVYDFHHLDPKEKEFNLGDILRKKDFLIIEKELTKCVLLCANCHRIRHFEGGNK